MTYLQENSDRILINHALDNPNVWSQVSIPDFYNDPIAKALAWSIIKFKLEHHRLPTKEEIIDKVDIRRIKADKDDVTLYLSMDPIDESTLQDTINWWKASRMIVDIWLKDLTNDRLTDVDKDRLKKCAGVLKEGTWSEKIGNYIETMWVKVCDPKFFKKTPERSNSSTATSTDTEGEAYDRILDNYAWIGPDIYLIYPNGERVKYNQAGFKARFPGRDISPSHIPNIFSSEGYKPNYFDPNRRIENNKYNTFKTPTAKIEEGDWSMTKILLKHIFGEQYELGLEYYWVKRHRPTQALPALCLVGDEDAGKSTIGLHQEMCFANAVKIQMQRLEKDENAFVVGVQDIIIEESSQHGSNKSVNPQLVVDKIKDMVTSTGGKIPCKQLYANAAETEYFAKIMMFSNDMTPIKMDGEATRFWIRRIGKPEKHENFTQILRQEVGAFLYYLDNQFEPSRTESKERLWFHPSEYWTLHKEVARNASGSVGYNAVKERLLEWFEENPNEEFCYFDLKSLKSYVCDDNFMATTYQLKDILLKEFKMTPPSGERKPVPDSLDVLKNTDGKWTKRKMDYFKINRDFKNIQTLETTEDLANVFEV